MDGQLRFAWVFGTTWIGAMAATWGEADFTRCNGERRLRLYKRFCDAPGQAQREKVTGHE